MYRKRVVRKTRSTIPKKYVKKRTTYRKNKVTTKLVKQVLKQAAEKKSLSSATVGLTLDPFIPGGTPAQEDCNVLCPYDTTFSVMSQGSGQGDRIGNRVNCTNFTLRIMLSVTGLGYPTVVKMYIGKLKSSIDEPEVNDFANLYQNGNINTYPHNLLSDEMWKINKDRWTVWNQCIFKIGKAANTAAASNNDFKFMIKKSFNLTKHLGGLIKYEDATPNPTNKNGYFWFTIANADNTPITGAYAPNVELSYFVDAQYTDL